MGDISWGQGLGLAGPHLWVWFTAPSGMGLGGSWGA